MGVLSLTDPVNGTPNDATTIANNNNAILTVVNGGIEDVNVAADAAIFPSKIASTYSNYTPTWTSSGTAPAIGNATVVARFAQIGKIIHAYGSITFGSTSTFGSGNYSLALPLTASTNPVGVPCGTSFIFDSSAGNSGIVNPYISTTTKMQWFYGATYFGTNSTLGVSAPWTWAVNDEVTWSILYELN